MRPPALRCRGDRGRRTGLGRTSALLRRGGSRLRPLPAGLPRRRRPMVRRAAGGRVVDVGSGTGRFAAAAPRARLRRAGRRAGPRDARGRGAGAAGPYGRRLGRGDPRRGRVSRRRHRGAGVPLVRPRAGRGRVRAGAAARRAGRRALELPRRPSAVDPRPQRHHRRRGPVHRGRAARRPAAGSGLRPRVVSVVGSRAEPVRRRPSRVGGVVLLRPAPARPRRGSGRGARPRDDAPGPARPRAHRPART